MEQHTEQAFGRDILAFGATPPPSFGVLVEGCGEGVRSALAASPRLRLLDGPSARPPRVALVALPADTGEAVEAVVSLKARHPGIRIVGTLSVLDAGAVRRLVEAGIDAFVATGLPARDIAAVVAAVAEGASLPRTAPAPVPDTAHGLTGREVEVLGFLSAGFSNKEVARRLDVSVRTVETHRFNLRRKTKAGRLKDLVNLARSMGLSPATEGRW